ncbi:hypothetical protein EDB83DRAFT_2317989 [Lactarius deliciosus]|nr:hypothetical protein EDB83DRAFT_2317989 [Lactarius deliciosus]
MSLSRRPGALYVLCERSNQHVLPVKVSSTCALGATTTSKPFSISSSTGAGVREIDRSEILKYPPRIYPGLRRRDKSGQVVSVGSSNRGPLGLPALSGFCAIVLLQSRYLYLEMAFVRQRVTNEIYEFVPQANGPLNYPFWLLPRTTPTDISSKPIRPILYYEWLPVVEGNTVTRVGDVKSPDTSGTFDRKTLSGTAGRQHRQVYNGGCQGIVPYRIWRDKVSEMTDPITGLSTLLYVTNKGHVGVATVALKDTVGLFEPVLAEPPALERRDFPANSIEGHTADIFSPTVIVHPYTATVENLGKIVALALSSVGKQYKELPSSRICGGNSITRPPTHLQ